VCDVFRGSDIAFGDTGIRRSILSNLADLYPGVYTESNVGIVSTHQHAGVGGYPENLLPQITSSGYVPETADAIVQGTVRAVQRAHASLAPGSLSVGNVTINGGNRNRSPNAYLANPASERARYNGDQDTALSLLKFTDASGIARGFLSFFAVHGTSLYEVKLLLLQDGINMGAHLLKEQHLG
jgi:neutral ceramidase